MEFKEFSYLLKVDTELFTHDIKRTKTYEDYESELNNKDNEPWSKDGGPYEIYDHICEPFCFKNRKTKWPTCNSNDDGYFNSGELSGMDEVEQEDSKRCKLIDDRELPICKIRRLEMIKYSFGQEEEYVAIKKYEYDDLTRTNDDACHAYQEIFRNMDEGWLVTRAELGS
ncbi:hypothetical protein Tco_0995235 [Tanacetum coccineum]